MVARFVFASSTAASGSPCREVMVTEDTHMLLVSPSRAGALQGLVSFGFAFLSRRFHGVFGRVWFLYTFLWDRLCRRLS